jgi:hypothetical protein
MGDLQKSYYPDGSIRSEVTLVNGLPHGMTRHWHPNGVLAKEIPVDNGIIDGIVRQWNDKGELLGSSDIRKGTGVHYMWYPSGKVMGETSMICGEQTGRMRTLTEEGDVISDTYWLKNEKVSRRRYIEACREDPSLPTYEDVSSKSKRRVSSKKRPFTADEGKAIDELATKLVAGPKVREASAWLKESRRPSRSLGEARGQEESLRLVNKIYTLGALAVHSVEINGKPDEDQNSGRLVVELPRDARSRKRLLKLSGALAKEMGFDPDQDVGQRYVIVMLD